MTPPGLDLLVVDYHSPNDLERMLQSITDTIGDLDVTVWIGIVEADERSRQITQAWCESDVADWRVEIWGHNVGYNRAINRLGEQGDKPVIGCFNADVQLTPGALKRLTEAAMTPEWGVVGPRQVRENGTISCAGIFGTQTKPQFRGWKARDGFHDVRDDAVYVQGSSLFLRRQVWDELTWCGQFRAFAMEPGPWLDVQHYYGDSYLSLHAQAHGYKAVYVGDCTIMHRCNARVMGPRDKPDRERFRAACDAHHIPHE